MDMTQKYLKVEQPVRRIKLSEAIRIGARMRPQCRSSPFADGRSCALGAAYEALHGKMFDGQVFPYSDLKDRFPELTTPNGSDSLMHAIIARNDTGHSREQIADWLEAQGY